MLKTLKRDLLRFFKVALGMLKAPHIINNVHNKIICITREENPKIYTIKISMNHLGKMVMLIYHLVTLRTAISRRMSDWWLLSQQFS